jgi:aminoglycoside 3-N-acetyltransferase I
MNSAAPPSTPRAFDVRPLGPTDIGLVRRLNALFAEAFEDAPSYAHAPPSDEYLRSVLAREHVIALVALQAGVVIGGLVAYELPKFEQARSEVYLYDLAVAEAHRRQGVATVLIARLRELAHVRGAWVVYVQADRGDDPAVALYTKLGTREDVMHFDLPVP